ncbi:aminopeptidase P family protein [Dinoroseobacter sp. S76]|uniref:aminopeptidase P family protein n=1 Tax=Dinoroseobacter sp. S76 TaxID=3415124 RepID=UPI003C7D7F7B
MFQSFSATTTPEQGPPRLAALRAEMTHAGVDAFLIPRADAHQGEYVAPRDDRLAWLTGFTGSAGFCIALADTAGVFVDGRYTLQSRQQVALEAFTPVSWPKTQPGPWLTETLGTGVVGFDPWLHTKAEIARLEKGLGEGLSLLRVDNLVDRIWPDQPAPPQGAVKIHPDALAGRSAAEKRAEIAEALRAANETAAILTLPDSLCWLLNIRGSDIPRNPVVHGFAILHADGGCDLFLDAAKLSDDVMAHLGPDVRIAAPESFGPAVMALSGPVRLDPATAPVAIFDLLESAGIPVSEGDDPCILPKACKTEAEISGTAEAHLRDGAAMVEFLAWLDAQDPGSLHEIDVVTALEGFRAATGALLDISFETICGTGPHGAIVHYRVTEDTNRAVTPGDLLLVDSGGQYADGTTDVTRTMATGTPPDGAVAAFTRVLQGMIAVSLARWPKGLAGRDLDALARAPLWRAGQDYDHGTGHGVGTYLCVHEGPQRLSRVSEVPLRPGMILSNEPGYYREGAFGIRIENLVVVTEMIPPEGGDPGREMLGFRTLTYVPIDRRLIDLSMLSPAERDWLDNYHAQVRSYLKPRVSHSARDWLIRVTAPL